MKQGVLIAALNGANVVAMFATQLLLYRAFGASHDTDVYFAAAAIPQLLAMVLTTAASAVLVPLFARQERSEQNRNAWGFLIVTVTAAVIGAVVLVPAAHVLVPLLWPGFSGPQAELALALIQIHLASCPLIVATIVLTSLQHARNHFAQTELLNLGLSCSVAIALLALLPRFGVQAAAWLLAGRYAVQVLILGRFAQPVTLHLNWACLATAWQRSRLLLAGNAFFKTDVLIDRYLLSMGAVGTLSLFALAQTMFGAVAGMIGQAWGNATVPRLATHFAEQNAEAFVGLYRHSKQRILIVSTSLVTLCCWLVPPTLAALTGRLLTPNSGEPLWLLLLALSGIPIFGALGSLVSGAFYALGDTKTPTYTSALTFVAFVGMKVWVFGSFGLLAFCALTTAYYAANALILGRLLKRSIAHHFKHDPAQHSA
jgi:putative peptidoglycan lipid II flippase